MSKVMETTGLTALLGRIAGEYRAKGTIYEIPRGVFEPLFGLEGTSPGLEVMGKVVSLPVGPAAGPHSQIAPNLVAAWLAGARVFELKTVQANDRLDIEKPCILALDEGHNTEWSTELSLEEAREEYLRGWIAINLLAELWSPRPRDFLFNMSVGYTLEGIKGERVDAFIEGMRAPAATPFWKAALAELRAFVAGRDFEAAFGPEARFRAAGLLADFPASPVHSVTLSTMHGCPPSEIEAIGRYLLEEKGFDTYVKLNPTLLGHDEARRILDAAGWERVGLKRETFEHDLQFADAVALVKRLGETAVGRGRRFGVKLSNTLANVNDGGRLPGAERYMSGRALFPLTIRLAEKLAEALPAFPRRFSYCGGVSSQNARELLAAGLGPLTVATDLLKPGGYLRLAATAREAVAGIGSVSGEGRPDAGRIGALAKAALGREEYRGDWKYGEASIHGPLPLFDCFAAPCVEACPVHQKVPEYIRLAAAGRKEEALALVLADNPLPCITGTLCDHVCQAACSRNDYEGPVRIRDVKLAVATGAQVEPKAAAKVAAAPKVAVIGAGPAGLAAAHYLAGAGLPVTLFDRDREAGGVVANVVPSFRIPAERRKADVARIAALGPEFRLGAEVADLASLKKEGFTRFIVCVGAQVPRELALAGEGLRVVDALDFLAKTARGDGEFAGLRRVVVAGGGNTAMDALRRASRIGGIASVKLSYRRSRADMPAEKEEVEVALGEAEAVETGAFLPMSLPERLAPGKLGLRRMKAGEPDASGRRSPVPSDETFEVPCDLLVLALGESPDAGLLARLGVQVGKDGKPLAAGPSGAVAGGEVFVAGDARRGPASIIAAEADGRAAAHALLDAAGIPHRMTRYAPPKPSAALLARRGEILRPLPDSDGGFLRREAERCLACDSACERCVEVCPNRAYLAVPAAPGERMAQILQIDALCNECGNCGSFCPWEGEPWRDKPALFATREALGRSPKAGFAIAPDRSLSYRPARGAGLRDLAFDEWYAFASEAGGEDARMIGLARSVLRDHPYTLPAAAQGSAQP